jgi:hypothetical protein
MKKSMFLRRLGFYCALALAPFALLAGCSPTAGIGSSGPATPQSWIALPIMPSATPLALPLAHQARGAQEIIGWPGILSLSAGVSVSASPAPTASPSISLGL